MDPTPRRAALALLAVVALALALRVIGLAENPPGFWFDESAVAVNAALIAEAGIDQYGRPWPLFFRALDDYKEPLFVYSVAFAVKLAGASVSSARAPAAAWGVLGVLVAFVLGREVLGSRAGGIWTALFVAVTPWHIHFSRWSEQAIVLTVTYSAAVWFMVRMVRRRTRVDAVLAGVLLAAGLYAYSPAKLLVAASLPPFVGFVWHRHRPATPLLVAFLAAFTVAALPFAAYYATAGGLMNLRFERIRIPWTEAPRAYVSHLDPRFLFGRGDADLHLATRAGMLPWYLGPLGLVGAIAVLARRSWSGAALVLILAFTPVLGALTHRYPHATRTLTALPFVQVLAAAGLLFLLERLPARARRIAGPAALLVVAVALGLFWRHYWEVYRFRSRAEWNHGLIVALEQAGREAAVTRETVYAPPAHYSDWMFATRVPAAVVTAARPALEAGHDRYDPRDLAGKYTAVAPGVHWGRRAREKWDPARPPRGIWVLDSHELPLGWSCEFPSGRYCVVRGR